MLKKVLLALAFAVASGFAFAAVDVNKADQAALDGVKGIGPAKSKAILDERKKGPFKDWADFESRVKGIGDKNSSALSEAGLTVNGQSKPGAAAKPEAKDAKKDAKDAKKEAKEMKVGVDTGAKDAKKDAKAEAKDAKKDMKAEAKDAKADAKDAKKDAKAEAKDAKKEMKAEAKDAKKDVKAEAKDAKADAKKDGKADAKDKKDAKK